MKAILCTSYGNPEVLQLQEIAKPVPKDDQVLIRVHRAVVTPSDCAFVKGEPFIVKLIYGLNMPKLAIQGVEFAGEIEAIGSAVTLFKKGDRVFGTSPDTFGAHAEYMCLAETAAMTTMSPQMSFEDAVGLSDGAPTSLTFLRDVARITAGQKILINGASGSVGVYGIQLAKYMGAEVTAVCSTGNLDLVRSLRADYGIDYTKEDFTQSGQTYDVIFDVMAKRSFAECKDSLTSTGIYITTFPSLAILGEMIQNFFRKGKKAQFAATGLMQNKANLDFLKNLFEVKKIRTVIDLRYPLEQIAEAYHYVEKGHKKGNVVVTVSDGVL